MIEVVYTPKDNKSSDVIRLPKNIKQIGDIKGTRKIYIEDYAINYIEEAHIGEAPSVVGVLLGAAQKSGYDRYIFIKGSVIIPDVFVSESEIMITESSWSYIYETAEKYFAGLEIVGWFVSLDGVNAGMLRTMKKVHTNQFAGGDKVLFVYDRQENARYFCVYENAQLVKQNGYIIYYERNEQMQNYMVDMRNKKNNEVQIDEVSMVENATFRKLINDNVEEIKPSGNRRQAFVNYCANVAMVVLVLFLGLYIMGERKANSSIKNSDNEMTTLTPVVKVDGNVYPTEETSQTASVEIVTETQTETVTQTVPEETTASYLTVSTNVGEEIRETQPETTAVSVTYREHTVVKGDSLITISKKYYGDKSMVSEIMKLNDIDDMDKIYIGQKIKLP